MLELPSQYSLGGGVPLGSRNSYPLLDQILQMLWPYTRLEMLSCSWFQSFASDPVKRDPILVQFSIITRPYTRLNGLKTVPFPAAHTRIANIWERRELELAGKATEQHWTSYKSKLKE